MKIKEFRRRAAALCLCTALFSGVTAVPAAADTPVISAGSEQIAQETQPDAAAESEAETAAAEPVEREVSEEEIDAFFSGSVFVGDSVMLGFRNYCKGKSDPFLKSLNFLAAVSFSVHNSFSPVSSKSVHPVYQGAQRPVWESISMMGAKHVFLFFGLNDMNMGNNTCELYQKLVANIRQLSPDIKVTIMSMTYTFRGKGKGKLNNDNIRVFNSQMQQIAQENGWGFVDIATPLADENGDLAAAYCSDHYVHQTNAAYAVWANVLRQYARDQLKYTPAPETPAEETVPAEETAETAEMAETAETTETEATAAVVEAGSGTTTETDSSMTVETIAPGEAVV